MAIYHLTVKAISRNKGQSAVASAAYRRAAVLYDERLEKYQNYSSKPDVIHSELVLPDNAPHWANELFKLHEQDPHLAAERLWNFVESSEKRKDARLAREVEFALPIELTPEQSIPLAREFIRDQFALRGMIADWSVHWDEGNPHVHVMLTTRELTEQGFGQKVTAWNSKALLLEWRKQWAEYANFHLRLHHHQVRIDHRSYKEQGIDLIPTLHQGKAVTDMERRGQRTHIMKEANQIRHENLQRISAKPEILLHKISSQRETFSKHHVIHELGRYINDQGHFNYAHSTSDDAFKASVREQLLKQRAETFTLHTLPSATIAQVLSQIEHHDSVFTEQTLAKMLLPFTEHAETFSQALLQIKASDELIYLGAGEDGRDRFTTRDMFNLENRIQAVADTLRARKHQPIAVRKVDLVLKTFQDRLGKPLTAEQRVAVKHVLQNTAISCIVGRAGTGKSFSLGAAHEVWKSQGLRVQGITLSGVAADGLSKEAGIPSRTIDSFCMALREGALHLTASDVIVMDEAGMTDSVAMEAVLTVVEKARAKLVLVGDHAQIQPVGPGATFRALVERLGFAEIQTIFRQKEAWQRAATVALSAGRVNEALQAYAANDSIIFEETLPKAMARLVSDWYSHRLKTQKTLSDYLIIAHRNEDVGHLNQLARTERIKAHEILAGTRVETSQGMLQLSTGERILFLKNNRQLGVSNGRFATIMQLEKR